MVAAGEVTATKSWTEREPAWGAREQGLLDAFAEQFRQGVGKVDIGNFIEFANSVFEKDYASAKRHVLPLAGMVKRSCLGFVAREAGKKFPSKAVERASDTYWRVVLMEARNRQLDSYLRYLERKRDPKRKFYVPRAAVFEKHGLTQMLQAMLDDELDICSISLPPGTGKAQPLYSKVLTPDGFKEMGDIKPGDSVISGTGNISTVLRVFPQDKKQIYEINLKDGRKCRCSEEHLWKYLYVGGNEGGVYVGSLSEIMQDSHDDRFFLPYYNDEGPVYEETYSRVKSIESVGEEECQCIYISDSSHLYITDDYIITHNTTIERFFATGVMGWWPDDYSLFYSHSDDIVRKFYDDAMDIVSNDADYAWGEIFNGLSVTEKDASLKQFNVGRYKPFPSLQCSSVGAKSAGKVRASKFLYVDDMVGKWEEAQNMNILNSLWDNYSVNALQRKIPGCKEIHIATRWSLYDIVGRIQAHHEGNPRARFLSVPATSADPGTGWERSNFEYDVNPMTLEFFQSQREIMDDAAYDALYDQKPIEKEGRLYDADALRRYFSLPEAEPDAVIGVCDTKGKGSDFMFLPCVYQYGDDYYLEDCVCDDSTDFGVQESKVVDIIMRNNMQMVQFESNTGGDRFAENVQRRLDKLRSGCSVSTKPTETNKETKILVNADWVKKHVVFKDVSLYKPRSDYGRMMHLLCTYSTLAKGRNVHDDVPDGLAMLSLFINNTLRRRQATVIHGGFGI